MRKESAYSYVLGYDPYVKIREVFGEYSEGFEYRDYMERDARFYGREHGGLPEGFGVNYLKQDWLEMFCVGEISWGFLVKGWVYA